MFPKAPGSNKMECSWVSVRPIVVRGFHPESLYNWLDPRRTKRHNYPFNRLLIDPCKQGEMSRKTSPETCAENRAQPGAVIWVPPETPLSLCTGPRLHPFTSERAFAPNPCPLPHVLRGFPDQERVPQLKTMATFRRIPFPRSSFAQPR